MKNILKSKKGLSTVVTTLIILVVSVLLATVVTYYAINITTNRMQQEDLSMMNLHVWYNTSGSWAEAAFSLTNTGGKDAVLQSITARSQQAAWANVYYFTTTKAVSTMNATFMQLTASWSKANMTLGGTATKNQVLTAASGVITVKSGDTLVVYIMSPGTIGQNDVGTPCDITVFTANAQWTQEVNVQAAQ